MQNIATMDLKPINQTFTFSSSGKAATIPCEFSGKYGSDNTVEIELFITYRAGNKPLKEFIADLQAAIADGKLLRATGNLLRLMYQDRTSGKEVEKYRLYALTAEPSIETAPLFSMFHMEGGMRKLPNTELFQPGTDTTFPSVKFSMFAEPSGDNEQETYLTIFVNGYGDVVERTRRKKFKSGAHIFACGKLQATNKGGLRMILFDIGYAQRPNNNTKE